MSWHRRLWTAGRISRGSVGALVVWAGALAPACDRESGEREAQVQAPASEKSGAAAAREAPESSEERYRVGVDPKRIAVGEKTDVSIRIEAREGLKVNREYPSWTLELDAPEDVEFGSGSFSRDDFELHDQYATARTTVTVRSPGEASVSGTANFSVCNDETCHILRDESVRFQVEATDEGETEASSNED